MTDQQFLGLNENYNKTDIRNAFIKKISELDFEIDIENFFKYRECFQRLNQRTEAISKNNQMFISDSEKENIHSKDIYDTPEKLLSHFTKLYEHTTSRFNKLAWKSAIDSVSQNDGENLAVYCKPVADFLSQQPFLKSDVLALIARTFPFGTFFPDPKKEENKEFWQQYGYVYDLLRRGNLEFDLHADILNTGQYTSEQIDNIFHRLSYSAKYYRNKQYAQAFNILSEGIPANIKPLIIWQRELNILYKAAVVEKTEGIDNHFVNTINHALTAFPNDEHLLYIRARFLFHRYNPPKFKEEIINTIKIIPEHSKCLFLLGKCYMQLGIYRAAFIIFENLKRLYPQNMEYVTVAALASRQYIDFCIREHHPKDNNKQYYINIIGELIELHMFDEVNIFAAQAPKEDTDIIALLMYAKCMETYVFHNQKDKVLLIEALNTANDGEIIRKIKELYLKDLPNWSDIKSEKEFILDYYQAFPNDAMANYHMGMSYYAEAIYEEAYQYMLKAKNINPSDTEVYYNLARAAAMIKRHAEAIDYISTYILYNKYNLGANELYCDWNYSLKEYDKAHTSAKWILSLCHTNDFLPKYFFYLTAGLALHLKPKDPEQYNTAYINDVLELYDQYSKPATFWTDDYGSKSMYWAASLCFKMGNHEKCVEYLQYILKNVKQYNWSLMELCLFELLPESLHILQRHNELIEWIEEPTRTLLNKKNHAPEARLPAYYIAQAYKELGMPEKKMEWVLNCAYCYMQSENPPIDWIENLLIDNFDICLEFNILTSAMSIGKSYMEIISTPNPNYIWITHYMGNICSVKGEQDEALNYHHACLDFGQQFPDSYPEQIMASQEFVNSFKPSDSLN